MSQDGHDIAHANGHAAYTHAQQQANNACYHHGLDNVMVGQAAGFAVNSVNLLIGYGGNCLPACAVQNLRHGVVNIIHIGKDHIGIAGDCILLRYRNPTLLICEYIFRTDQFNDLIQISFTAKGIDGRQCRNFKQYGFLFRNGAAYGGNFINLSRHIRHNGFRFILDAQAFANEQNIILDALNAFAGGNHHHWNAHGDQGLEGIVRLHIAHTGNKDYIRLHRSQLFCIRGHHVKLRQTGQLRLILHGIGIDSHQLVLQAQVNDDLSDRGSQRDDGLYCFRQFNGIARAVLGGCG